ncbi:asparaginase [Undibacterium sp.]|uniref:asparaginase n=1 Tax=Undibacterium sp. TaxID=1914977 RepID=UPI00374D0F5C
MKLDPVSRAPVPAITGDDLIATVPSLADIANVEVENLFNLPSDYMAPELWIQLHRSVTQALEDERNAGVVISHGTDTLEETAWFLELTISSSKPVVVIGAQRNASSVDSDGPRNLLNGVRVCVCAEARSKGVMVVLNGQINAARDATKSHTSDVEAFKSGDAGYLGNLDDDRVVFYRQPTRKLFIPLVGEALPHVEIVCMYAGASGAMVRAAVSAGASGIVIQALGWGNVNIDMYEAIQDAIDDGVSVVISTRVHNGRVRPVYGFTGGGKTLKDIGAVFGDNLSPQKARILLMLALQTRTTANEMQALFDR